MEAGSVYSGRWIRWLPAGKKAPFGYGQFRHEKLVGMGRWRMPTVNARRCPACRVVEFGY